MNRISETETVVKKIIPYLQRRGYDVGVDFTFEYPAVGTTAAKLGFVDILVKHSGKNAFLIEAKRIAKTLSDRDRVQAITYGVNCKVPFVVLTNGIQFESINSATGKRVRWNGKLSDKVPSKVELSKALSALRKDRTLVDVPLMGDTSLPFRQGLPLKQLNALFSRCHKIIRKIERNEDYAFSDFSKILFLKLLEEKADSEGTSLPYTYRFHEMAEKLENEADQVKTAILSMLESVKSKTPYGEVLQEDIHLKNAKTFRRIVIELASVSFRDTRTDSKGAAFEYFVRATLKGKKLGQYFTPRQLIELMQCLVGREKVLNGIAYGGSMRVVDPACGTGGFLVYFLLSSIELANEQYKAGKITSARRNQLIENLKKKVFFGADAHEGVAASAKMNMIIAGDGHSNIQCQDSLSKSSTIWSAEYPKIDLIITNPPFGTSETENIIQSDLDQFPVKSSKGQILFVQKMVQSTIPGGEICTVIDEGLLNTDQAAALRAYIMEHTLIRGIVRLPDVTFKPNKINVRSSILHLIKRGEPNPDLDDDYPILFLDVFTLGYQGSGELIRNQNFHSVLSEIGDEYHGVNRENVGASGQKAHWRWFTRSSLNLAQDATKRFDLKYWDPSLIERLVRLSDSGVKTIKELNQVKTKRGKSPAASLYVDEADGYALVIKAGTNITRQGTVISTEDSDFIEKNVYDEMSAVHVQDGDILLSSTGDGTLGKCAVFRGKIPAIYDGHVTLIRVDSKKIYPEYVCDYLRLGFGQDQISRLYTGSTGLIELPPDQVDRILVQLPSINLQKSLSKSLRKAENNHLSSLDFAKALLIKASEAFRNH